MSREKSLLKNTMIITIGKICTQLITFLLLPLYTSVLSTEEYGIVDLLNTLISLMLPIITFQIEQAVFRKLIDNRNNEKEIRKVISTTIFTIIFQIIIYSIVFILLSSLVNNKYKYFLLTNVMACIFSNIMLQISRGLGDNKCYAIGSFLTALSTIILNIILVVALQLGVYGMLTASLCGNVISAIYILIVKKIYKYLSISLWNFDLLKTLWRYSIPLIPNAISWWIFNSSDRIIVSAILGIGQNGILSAAYKFPGVYITLYNILNMTLTESASLHINDSDVSEFLSNIINTIFKFFAAIGLGIIVCMPFVFSIMINEKFYDAYYQIPILMISTICNIAVSIISVIYIAKKDTKAVAKTSAIAALINLTVNLLLIKFIGLYAASISTLVSYLVMAIYRYKDVQKYVKINLDRNYLIILAILIPIILISYYVNMFCLNLIMLAFIIIFAIISNKELIEKTYFYIKKQIIVRFNTNN